MLAQQIEIENHILNAGRASILAAVARNEQEGRASSNPYNSVILRNYLPPLTEAIKKEYTHPKKTTGVLGTTKALLKGADPQVLAFLTIKHCVTLLTCEEDVTANVLARDIGLAIQGEHILNNFESINPNLYHALNIDLKGRMSKSERHRLAVYRSQAAKEGIPLPEWTTEQRTTVGAAMIVVAEALGLIEVIKTSRNGKRINLVSLTDEVFAIMQKITMITAINSPKYLPCIIPPRDWVSPNDGGFYSDNLRRVLPCVIVKRSFIEDGEVPARVLTAVNKLQQSAWQVNTDILAIIEQAKGRRDIGELVTTADVPPPSKPSFIDSVPKELMSDEQLQAFLNWKRSMAHWYLEKKIRIAKFWRSQRAVNEARQFAEYEKLYFVYSLDYRGRMYAMAGGLTPQGSDLQRSLLRSAVGCKLDTPQAVRWFLINGANKFGYDKATLDDRVKWVQQNHELLLAVAEQPLSNLSWADTDSPFQFLAWCLEYAAYCKDPDNFVSKIPVQLDGSCNGLQHYSAILRDAVGGVHTNLTDTPTRMDIYENVARLTDTFARQSVPNDELTCKIKRTWLDHGITRTLVKRSVMTLPYGATRYSCARFIQDDYLNKGLCPAFDKEEYGKAAYWLSIHLWEAINKTVIKAREGMNWLQESAKTILEQHQEIQWRNPIGMLVTQHYPKRTFKCISSHLAGGVRLQLAVTKAEETPSVKEHCNGIAPNFIHSCDASHMQLTINALASKGVSFYSMIHDDFGVLASEAQTLYEVMRDQLVTMYLSYDPLVGFYNKYKDSGIEPPPSIGTLDLTKIKSSQFAFC